MTKDVAGYLLPHKSIPLYFTSDSLIPASHGYQVPDKHSDVQDKNLKRNWDFWHRSLHPSYHKLVDTSKENGNIYTHTHTHTHIYIYTHTYIYTYMYTHTHTHTYTYIRVYLNKAQRNFNLKVGNIFKVYIRVHRKNWISWYITCKRLPSTHE